VYVQRQDEPLFTDQILTAFKQDMALQYLLFLLLRSSILVCLPQTLHPSRTRTSQANIQSFRIIPAEIFDTHTRSKGVSIATMTSFAFNTMIGLVTNVAMNAVSWRFFLLFVVCNFTNAIFFWIILPETAQLPLEEMNYLFSNAPWIVPGSDKSTYTANLREDLERRADEVRDKGADAVLGHEEGRKETAA
jgi:hypothetical protein